MMVATLQLKAPKLIVYFVSFTVVIFTILNIQEPMTALLDFNQPMTVFNEPFAVCDITKAVRSFTFYDSFLLFSLLTFSRLF